MYAICFGSRTLTGRQGTPKSVKDTYIYKGAVNTTKGHITLQRNIYLYKGTTNSTKGHPILQWEI